MKRNRFFISLLLLLGLLLMGGALAGEETATSAEDPMPVQEEWNGYPPFRDGYVLCETLTVRERPQSTAKALTTLPYGSHIRIIESVDNWYRITDSTVYGWVRSEYVLVQPEMFSPTEETPVYALPDAQAKRVGLLDAGSGPYAIIDRYGNFLAISLRGACGFVLEP